METQIAFTKEQSDILHRVREPRFVDPTTQKVYFVLSSELYERLKDFLEDEAEQASWQGLVDKGRASILNDDSAD